MKRKGPKRRRQLQQRNEQKKPSFSQLKTSLKTLNNSYENGISIENHLLKEISFHLPCLDKSNFDTVGILLPAYVKVLTVDPEKNKKSLDDFSEKLRKLGKIKEQENILDFTKVFKERFDYFTSNSIKLRITDQPGSFFDYYFFYDINQLLKQKGSDVDVVGLVIPYGLSCIQERYYPRLFLIALGFVLKDLDAINELLEAFNFKTDALQQLMSCAVELGRCDAVELLLGKNVPLPESIDKVILTFVMAIALENSRLINAILEKFTAEEIFLCAQRNHLFPIVVYLIEQDKIKVNELLTYPNINLETVIELAAARYDLPLLKKLWPQLSEQEGKYKKNVIPYLFPESNYLIAQAIEKKAHLEEHERLYNEIINVIRYYMERRIFTFSLEEEEKDQKFFGPKALGHLLMWMTCKTRKKEFYMFGLIRQFANYTTVYQQNYRSDKCKLIEDGFLEKDTKESTLLQELGKKGKEFSVCYGGGNNTDSNCCLTRYCKPDHRESVSLIFFHTEFEKFKFLLEEINKLYQQVRSSSILLRSLGLNSSQKVSVFQTMARINWLYTHLHLYEKGSADACNMIIQAMLLNYTMKFFKVLFSVMDQYQLGEAMLYPNIEDFVKAFPQLLIASCGVNDYEILVEHLRFFNEDKQDKKDSIVFDQVEKELDSVICSPKKTTPVTKKSSNAASLFPPGFLLRPRPVKQKSNDTEEKQPLSTSVKPNFN